MVLGISEGDFGGVKTKYGGHLSDLHIIYNNVYVRKGLEERLECFSVSQLSKFKVFCCALLERRILFERRLE